MKKILVLGLICSLFIFSCDRKKVEVSTIPEIDEVVNLLPTIVSFTAENPERGRFFTLRWEVLRATNIRLRISNPSAIYWVKATGTMQVEARGEYEWDPGTVTCTLMADDDGHDPTSKSLTIETITAVTEVTTIPEMPIFTYNPNTRCYRSYFFVLLTETNGIGAKYTYLEVRQNSSGSYCSTQPYLFSAEGFEPFGSVEIYAKRIDTRPDCIPQSITLTINVPDDNGYWLETIIRDISVIRN